MNCEQIRSQLNAWLDGELPPRESELLRNHFTQCASCRGLLNEHEELDKRLRAAFQPARDSARRVAEQVRAELPVTNIGHSSRKPWSHPLLAAAAGFLLAVFIFRPWHRPELDSPDRSDSPVLATLAVATGPVQMMTDQAINWLQCPPASPVFAGNRIRTGAGQQCEFQTNSGAIIRLNVDTEVAFHNPSHLDLTKGQLWCRSTNAEQPLSVSANQAIVSVSGGSCDIATRANDTRVFACDGFVTVSSSAGERTLNAGAAVTLADEQIYEDESVIEPILATSWLHELLQRKGTEDPELRERVNHLWAALGSAKITHLYEQELRKLGDGCSLPLSSYLLSEDSREEPHKRVKAAAILADLASQQFAPQFIRLLQDQHPEVRYHAARALERLTGNNFGWTPNDWRDSPISSCVSRSGAWRDWLTSRNAKLPRNSSPESFKASRRKKKT